MHHLQNEVAEGGEHLARQRVPRMVQAPAFEDITYWERRYR